MASEHTSNIEKKNILEALDLSMFAIAFTPIIEVLLRGYHFIIAFFAIETPLVYFRFLNFIWKKNLSPSKRLIHRQNQQTLARSKELLARISLISTKNLNANPELIKELEGEVNEIEDACIKRQNQLQTGTRFKEDLFDKNQRRKKINLLSDKLLGVNAD